MTKRLLLFIALASMASPAVAQKAVPVDDLTQREQVTMGQQQAGEAYRRLQQAQYDAKLAEQDYLNTEDAYRAQQKQVDALKHQVDAAKKTLDAARAQEAAARKAYDQAVDAVDRMQRAPQPK